MLQLTISQLSLLLEPSQVKELLSLADMVANWNIDVRPGHAEYQSRAEVIAEAQRVAGKVGLRIEEPVE